MLWGGISPKCDEVARGLVVVSQVSTYRWNQGVVTPICAILRAAAGVTNCDRLNSTVTL